jgi:hypothetical protein
MTKLFLFLTMTILSSIYNSDKTSNVTTRYAFVTDTERDKSLDEGSKNGYVTIVTEVIAYSCNVSDDNIKYQFIDHYNAFERNQNRERSFVGSSGVTNTWSYSSYDEAMKSRRDWLAKDNNEHKRTIYNFYISCK